MIKENEQTVKQTLDLLIEKANSPYDLITIKFSLHDYMTEGYYIKEQIQKYNEKRNKLLSKSNN